MSISVLVIIPIVSALAGWLLNIGLTSYLLRSYLPAQWHNISAGLGEIVSQNIEKGVAAKISDPALVEKSMPLIENHIDTFLSEKLPQQIPMLSMFITSKTTDQVKTVFMNELRGLFPAFMATTAQQLKNEVNFNDFLSREMKNKTSKDVFEPIFSKSARKLQLWGFLGGFLIGCINVLIIYLSQ